MTTPATGLASMYERSHPPRLVELNQSGSDAEESWLISYLDVLTLLITLFVLLLALADPSTGDDDATGASPGALEGRGLLPAHLGTLPARRNLPPALRDLDGDGISVENMPEGVALRIEERLLFGSGEARLRGQGLALLERLAARLSEVPGEIAVEGHTDNRPISNERFPSNWELSGARASAVLRALVAEGVDPDRLRAVGYADTRPLGPNGEAEGRQANRRVELLITSPAP